MPQSICIISGGTKGGRKNCLLCTSINIIAKQKKNSKKVRREIKNEIRLCMLYSVYCFFLIPRADRYVTEMACIGRYMGAGAGARYES